MQARSHGAKYENLKYKSTFNQNHMKNIYLAVLIILAGAGNVWGQNVSTYTFSQSAGTYSSISGTAVGFGTAWDDAQGPRTVLMPFNFMFRGSSYSSVEVNCNGYITFGVTTSAPALYTPISATTAYDGAISALGRDLINNGSDATYTTLGSAPNRVFVIQWNNARRFSLAGDWNFQIRLSESTNVINIVYGACAATNTSNTITVQVGLRGAANTDYNNRNLAANTAWLNTTTLGTSNAANVRSRNTALPASGTTFTWTPPTANYRYYMYNLDFGSTNWCTGESRTVTVLIKNTGTNTWTNSAPDINIGIKWNTNGAIWNDYFVRTDAGSVAPGASATYSLTIEAKNATAGPTYGTNLSSGSNNLTLDMVNEGNCWLGNNPGTCGAGNATMNMRLVSAKINIIPLPSAVNAGADVTLCAGSSTSISGIATPNPVILFSEDFESYLNNYYVYGGWSQYIITNGDNDWLFSSTGAITGSRSLTIADSWLGVSKSYDKSVSNQVIAYTTNLINAIGFDSLKINFKWQCQGENLYDYGRLCYSTNATTWTDFSATNYVLQSSTQTVTNLGISAVNNSQFYLGFRFINDNSVGTDPPFTIDDISITGIPALSYAWTPTSGLSNPAINNPVATPLSTTNYIMTATAAGCSVSDTVALTVVPNSVIPSSISGPTTICHGNSTTLTEVGGSLSIGASYEWFSGTCGGASAGSGTAITVTPTATTNYYVRASAGTHCPATACLPITVTLPTAGTTLANNTENATCVVNQNGYVHFYHSSGRLLASINSNGQDLGNVDVTAYVGAAANVPACNYPDYESAFMGRRFVITPTIQPTSNVDVIMHFDNSEFNSLVTLANGNSTGDDDLTVITDLAISKYSGPNNVDGNAANNCLGAGGSGGATLHTQAASGNTDAIFTGFSSTSRYVQVGISSFSEFWFGGNGSTPLATELYKFSASCTDSKNVTISWSTASEIDCATYGVFKSFNGIDWSFVNSRNCSANSNSIKNYEVIDTDRNQGKTYYRLIEKDLNGIESILETLSISCSDNNGLNAIVYPNPTQDDFTLEINSTENESIAIELLDLSGKVISQKSIQLANGTTIVPFNSMNLSSGTYLIYLKGIEKELKPIRVVIQ